MKSDHYALRVWLVRNAKIWCTLFISLLFTSKGATQNLDSSAFMEITKVKARIISGDLKINTHIRPLVHVAILNTYPDGAYSFRMKKENNLLNLSEEMANGSGDSQWDLKTPEMIDLEFSSASGDISSTNHNGYWTLRTASGTISLTNHIGKIEATQASGGIYLKNCTGTFTLSSASGDMELHEIEITNSSNFRTASGDIVIDLKSKPNNDIFISSASGVIKLDLNNFDINARLELIADDESNIISPFPYDFEETFRGEDNKLQHRKSINLGTGKTFVQLSVTSGKIIIIK